MRKLYSFLCLIMILGISFKLSAQTDPGKANLTHQWTFDDGTAKDVVGTCDGTLMAGATISSKALNTINGGYLTLPGEQIAINTYSAVSIEVWFTSASGQNTGNHMISYFGGNSGSYGVNYIFTTPSNGGKCRTAISTGNTSSPWSVETGVNSPAGKIDDGQLHHLISIIDATSIYYYVDGLLVGSTALTNNNTLSALDNTLAYLCKGGYTGDPVWKGIINKVSMYNRALTADEVLYLYLKGAESSAVITATVNSLAFDEHYPAEVFSVTSANLSSKIKITAPAGITVDPTEIAANTSNVNVTAFYSGTTPVDGKIVLTSGSNTVEIPVKTASDASCLVPLYTNLPNLVTDPGVNNLSAFAGWGTRTPVTIITDPAHVYCGAADMQVGNGASTCSGSLDFTLTGLISPNTTYVIRAMVKTMDGSFQVGVFGYDSSQGDLNNIIDTQGEWKPVQFTFTTGATLKDSQGMFFNSCGSCTGKTGYIDNWEMYVYTEPVLAASVKDMAFDPEYKSSTFTVTGSNLSSAVTVTAPAGITVDKASITPDAGGFVNEKVTVTYTGSSAVTDKIVVANGSKTINIPVKTTSVSNKTCFNALYPTKPNLIPDPYGNDPTKFAGWGAKEFVSIASEPDSVYCGSHTIRIAGSGSVDVNIENIIKKNTTYIARVMVRTMGGQFQLGAAGYDVNGAKTDVDSIIDTKGAWKLATLEFTTGDSLKVGNQLLFLNNYQLTGTRCYIDNWELYEKVLTSVPGVNEMLSNMFVRNGKIVAEFEANSAAEIQLSVYNVQGELVSNESFAPVVGRNTKTINKDLPSGMYIVKLSQDGQSTFRKLIK